MFLISLLHMQKKLANKFSRTFGSYRAMPRMACPARSSGLCFCLPSKTCRRSAAIAAAAVAAYHRQVFCPATTVKLQLKGSMEKNGHSTGTSQVASSLSIMLQAGLRGTTACQRRI